MTEVAPSCPISVDQTPGYRSLFRGANGPVGPLRPQAPIATDLPSLIRTTNVLRDILRSLTTSLTVNNTYLPRPPNYRKDGDKYYSEYPQWEQVGIETSAGTVFRKDKTMPDGIDPEHRVNVVRQNRVHFLNRSQEDPEFTWSYTKPIK